MRYDEYLCVPAHVAEDLEYSLHNVVSDDKKDGLKFDQEVIFGNGMRMAIQVCASSSTNEEPCYSQAVLYSSDGNKLHAEFGSSFLGEWWLKYEDILYVTHVMVSDPYQPDYDDQKADIEDVMERIRKKFE